MECPRCGPYTITDEAAADMTGWHRGDAEKIARIGHGVRKRQRHGDPPFITNELVQRFLEQQLPSVFEQANNLILWFGENVPPGETKWIEPATHQFVVGAGTPHAFGLVVDQLFATDYLAGNQSQTVSGPPGRAHAKLTFRGWSYYDEIRRGRTESRKAFMAMEYGHAELDQIVRDVFRPAVDATGFSLVRLDDAPRAGLIDDRLRVEINTSRFLLADLTHRNAGAYWEAGYAEGLGKPVIYLCDRAVFDRASTHFDTNHHLTVIWDRSNLALATEQLKATIRATLPSEAKLED